MDRDDQILALTPFERPDASLAAAACRAGARGVLDLGRDRERALAALAELERLGAPGCAGVRIVVDGLVRRTSCRRRCGSSCSIGPAARVVAPAGRARPGHDRRGGPRGRGGRRRRRDRQGHRERRPGRRRELVRAAPAARRRRSTLPVWAQGGIGLHTAAACVAAGARRRRPRRPARAACASRRCPRTCEPRSRAMDGSETRVDRRPPRLHAARSACCGAAACPPTSAATRCTSRFCRSARTPRSRRASRAVSGVVGAVRRVAARRNVASAREPQPRSRPDARSRRSTASAIRSPRAR